MSEDIDIDALRQQDTIHVHVTPKARKNELAGWKDDADGQRWLRVRVTTVPEDGKANKAVIKLLAKALGVPVSALTLVSGHTSRYKKLHYDPNH